MRNLTVAALTLIAGLALGQSPAPLPITCPAPQPATTCVAEPKHNTRKVFSCKIEEYCVPYCNLFSCFKQCGCNDGPCGELRIRHRLMVKKVPDCDTTQCVPKKVPLASSTSDKSKPTAEVLPAQILPKPN